MQADIITIGDEILIGQIVNTNAAWLGAELTQLGFSIRRMLTIPDLAEAIRVITSYSIHYTKLYEAGIDNMFHRAVVVGRKVRNLNYFWLGTAMIIIYPIPNGSFNRYVITSYSIHYTKLYEFWFCCCFSTITAAL